MFKHEWKVVQLVLKVLHTLTKFFKKVEKQPQKI